MNSHLCKATLLHKSTTEPTWYSYSSIHCDSSAIWSGKITSFRPVICAAYIQIECNTVWRTEQQASRQALPLALCDLDPSGPGFSTGQKRKNKMPKASKVIRDCQTKIPSASAYKWKLTQDITGKWITLFAWLYGSPGWYQPMEFCPSSLP